MQLDKFRGKMKKNKRPQVEHSHTIVTNLDIPVRSNSHLMWKKC